MIIPDIALSVRQPWAWAIVHAGKDVENRSAAALQHMKLVRGAELAIHAAKGMTRAEYEDAHDYMAAIGVACPPARDLLRGGIIGAGRVVEVVSDSASQWFFGPRAIQLSHAKPCEFIPARGALGLFNWVELRPGCRAAPAKWMLAAAPSAVAAELPL